MTGNKDLDDVIASIRPALNAQPTDQQQRKQFIADVVRELYDYVKYDVNGPNAWTPERAWLGDLLDKAAGLEPPAES